MTTGGMAGAADEERIIEAPRNGVTASRTLEGLLSWRADEMNDCQIVLRELWRSKAWWNLSCQNDEYSNISGQRMGWEGVGM